MGTTTTTTKGNAGELAKKDATTDGDDGLSEEERNERLTQAMQRHQARARGPINPLTRQPIHGRKVHGGIRLGEMERDALLAHGASFIVQERLLHCSDEAKTLICAKCHSLLSPAMQPPRGVVTDGEPRQAHCRMCEAPDEYVGELMAFVRGVAADSKT